jgi:hypothetical protein
LEENGSACEQQSKQHAPGHQCVGPNLVKRDLDPQKGSGPDAAENYESCPVFGLHECSCLANWQEFIMKGI